MAALDAPVGEPRVEMTGPPSLGKRVFNRRTLLSFAIGFAVLAFVFSRSQVDPASIAREISQAQLGYFLLALLVYYCTFPVRGLRWRLLLNNAGMTRASAPSLPGVAGLSEIIFLSWFANCVVPAKLGDAYRAYLLKRAGTVSFSKTIGTVLAERIIDMLLLFALLVGSVLLSFHGTLPESVQPILLAGLGLMVAIVVAALAMRNLGELIRKVVPARFHHHYTLLEEGTFQSFQGLPAVLGLSVVCWLVEIFRLYFVMRALGVDDSSLAVVAFAALAGALLTSLPVTPAGLGFVEGGIVGILLLGGSMGIIAGIDTNLAYSVALLDRSISYWSLVIFGFIAYLLTGKR